MKFYHAKYLKMWSCTHFFSHQIFNKFSIKIIWFKNVRKLIFKNYLIKSKNDGLDTKLLKKLLF